MPDHTKDHVSALFELEVCDEDGTVVNSVSGMSDSFLTNFILLLQAAMGNAAVAITDTSGVSRSCLGFSCVAATYGITNSSIVVGTGTNTVLPGNYALQAQNLTMEYAPLMLTQPIAPSIVGSNIESMVCKRTFNNNTGATVNINELGICVISSTFSILILRDVLGVAVPVLDHQTLHVSYTFRTAI